MLSAAEQLRLEQAIARLTDAELVSAVEHPEEYEPEALLVVRRELRRRAISVEEREQLRAENAARDEREKNNRELGTVFVWKWVPGIAVIFGVLVVKFLLRGK